MGILPVADRRWNRIGRRVLSTAGEPPLLARIVALLSQHVIARSPGWTDDYRALEAETLRPQWKRDLVDPVLLQVPNSWNIWTAFNHCWRKTATCFFRSFSSGFRPNIRSPTRSYSILPQADMDGASLVRMADLLGWPSDYETWKRVLGWLLSVAPNLPARLVPNVVELFKVWQNVFAGVRNDISERIIMLCG